jgi:hypothetical protein
MGLRYSCFRNNLARTQHLKTTRVYRVCLSLQHGFLMSGTSLFVDVKATAALQSGFTAVTWPLLILKTTWVRLYVAFSLCTFVSLY